MFKKIIVSALLAGTINTYAHEGHDATPGSIKANHGGTVKSGKEINLEYVVSGTTVKLYPVTHEGIDLATADIKLTATAKLPKGKAEPVKIEIKDGVFQTTVDFKSAYRTELVVNADTKGKVSTFKFQIEK